MKSTNRVDSWQCDADTSGREVTRTAHTAPPTLDGDGATVRAWLAEGST